MSRVCLGVQRMLGAALPIRNLLFSMTERLIPKARGRTELHTLNDCSFIVIRNYRTKMRQKRRLALRRENYRRKRSQNSPEEGEEKEERGMIWESSIFRGSYDEQERESRMCMVKPLLLQTSASGSFFQELQGKKEQHLFWLWAGVEKVGLFAQQFQPPQLPY